MPETQIISVETLINPVRQVLLEAPIGKGHGPQAMTSYQIADGLYNLDRSLYEALEEQKGLTGNGSMFHLISKACLALNRLEEIIILYMDGTNVEFVVAGGRVAPSYPVIALYKLA